MAVVKKISTNCYYSIINNLKYDISILEADDEYEDSLIEIGYNPVKKYGRYTSIFKDINFVKEIVKNLREEKDTMTYGGKTFRIIDNTLTGNWWDRSEELIFHVEETIVATISETNTTILDI